MYQIKALFITNKLGTIVLPMLSSASFAVSLPVMMIYGYLTNRFILERVFQILLIVMGTVVLFTMFLFIPNEDYFTLKIDPSTIGTNWYYISLIASKWFLILLYYTNEFWASLLYTTCMWNIINTSFYATDTKQYYTTFVISSTMGMFGSGFVCLILSKIFYWWTNAQIVNLFSIVTLIMIIFMYYLSTLLLNDTNLIERRKNHLQVAETRTTLGFWASIKHVTTSKYILIIGVIQIFLGALASNMDYILQPAQQNFTASFNTFPKGTDAFMRTQLDVMLTVNCCTFIISSLLGLFCKVLFRHLGWFIAISVLPVVTLVLAITVLFLYYQSLSPYYFQGFVLGCVVFINGLRYSFGDVLPEVLYQPLDKENQSKGKAGVKIFAKLGKFVGTSILTVIAFTTGQITIDVSVFSIVLITIFLILLFKIAHASYNSEKLKDYKIVD